MRAETVAQTTVKETVATTRVGDIRVSTADQRLDAQRERLTTRIRTRGLNGARGAHPLRNTVGEGDLRNFAGAIDAAGTTKGVFVTTAGFTRVARDYVARSPKRTVLIDGGELVGWIFSPPRKFLESCRGLVE